MMIGESFRIHVQAVQERSIVVVRVREREREADIHVRGCTETHLTQGYFSP
jgi:hypothetical protein